MGTDGPPTEPGLWWVRELRQGGSIVVGVCRSYFGISEFCAGSEVFRTDWFYPGAHTISNVYWSCGAVQHAPATPPADDEVDHDDG